MPVYKVTVERHSVVHWTVRAEDKETAKNVAVDAGAPCEFTYDATVEEVEDNGQEVEIEQ